MKLGPLRTSRYVAIDVVGASPPGQNRLLGADHFGVLIWSPPVQ
jgi:hypothetical protein